MLAVLTALFFQSPSPRAAYAQAATTADAGRQPVSLAAPTTTGPALPDTSTARPGVCSDGQASGDHLGEVEDRGRTYRIHIPVASRGTLAPLVLNFHGSSRTAADQEEYSGLLPLADREGFILVSPDGSGSPSGWDIPGVYHEIGVDDVAFVRALIAQLMSTTCINPLRVYATGLSNGAQMASQVACLLPDLFAAVAPVSGVQYQGCDQEPVPLVAFHGTADENIPYGWPASAAWEWSAHNGCTAGDDQPVTLYVTARVFSGCTADVVFYTIAGGGHTWPGAADNTGGSGFTTHEISASEIIWQFFAAHSRS